MSDKTHHKQSKKANAKLQKILATSLKEGVTLLISKELLKLKEKATNNPILKWAEWLLNIYIFKNYSNLPIRDAHLNYPTYHFLPISTNL